MLIQGLLTNGTFDRIDPYKYRNPTITFITVLFRSNQVIFNNVDFTNVIANSNDKEITIPPVNYSIGEINAIPNSMTHTRFLIFSKASSGECIWIQFPHTINCTNAPDILEIFSLEGCTVILLASFYGSNVVDITLNHQVIQVFSLLVRSSDLKIANQNNNLLTTIMIDDPTADYIRTMEDICKL